MPTTKLVIIRRPESNKNAGLSGDPEASSPEGQKQLAHIATVCKKEEVRAVIYSTELRGTMAGKHLAWVLGVPAIEQNGIQERDFGDWSSWEWERIVTKLNKLTLEERYAFLPPHGESWEQMERRLRKALQEVAALNHSSVAVLTHYGPIRALLPILRNEPIESTLQLEVPYGATFVEDYTDSTTLHLKRAG